MPPVTSVNGHGDTISGLTGRREVQENIPPTPTTNPTFNVSNAALNKQQKLNQQQLQQQQQQQQQLQQTQVENGRGRRSNVVKEVERLKKNREERRQRQAELKEEKEALMNLDPGNPNWEFLAMIRFDIISLFIFCSRSLLSLYLLEVPKYLYFPNLVPIVPFFKKRNQTEKNKIQILKLTFKSNQINITKNPRNFPKNLKRTIDPGTVFSKR